MNRVCGIAAAWLLAGFAPSPTPAGDHIGDHPGGHVGGPPHAPTDHAPATEPLRETIYYRYCAGVILRAVPDPEPGAYALALLQGETWQDYGRALYDGDGRMLRQEVTGRGAVTFDPHNCEKMPGICTYTETGLDGTAQKKLRINGLEGEEWNYSLIDAGEGAGEGGIETQVLTRVGTVTYAPDGLAARETWSSVTGTEDGCLTRIPATDLPPGAE